VPEGATVNARVLGSERRALAGFKPFPIQPDEAPSLLMDQAAYAGQTGLTPPPVAAVGQTAKMGALTVVPLTLRPVAWDAQTGELTVLTRVEVELSFTGASPAAARAPTARR